MSATASICAGAPDGEHVWRMPPTVVKRGDEYVATYSCEHCFVHRVRTVHADKAQR